MAINPGNKTYSPEPFSADENVSASGADAYAAAEAPSDNSVQAERELTKPVQAPVRPAAPAGRPAKAPKKASKRIMPVQNEERAEYAFKVRNLTKDYDGNIVLTTDGENIEFETEKE